jgi:hypothetical protein
MVRPGLSNDETHEVVASLKALVRARARVVERKHQMSDDAPGAIVRLQGQLLAIDRAIEKLETPSQRNSSRR